MVSRYRHFLRDRNVESVDISPKAFKNIQLSFLNMNNNSSKNIQNTKSKTIINTKVNKQKSSQKPDNKRNHLSSSNSERMSPKLLQCK